MNTLLDDAPMIQTRGEYVCCLLCLRQFESEAKVCKHVAKSAMHADNLAAASKAGRIASGASSEVEPSKKRAAETSQPPKKSPRIEPAPDPVPAASSGGMSALEQMELFEKRLKVQAKRQPDKLPVADSQTERQSASSNARTVNGQMDWECGHCGEFNFARVVSCGRCSKHVDASTKYQTNRLKEIKYERFARLAEAGDLPGRAPNLSVPNPTRTDGSSSRPAERASFSS